MTKAKFSYLKLAVVVAVLAIAIIGLNGRLSRTTVAREKSTTTPREIASTLEQKFSKQAAALAGADMETTATALPFFYNLGGVQITTINLDDGALEDKVEIGWSFTMPQELAALGPCVVLDHFDVGVDVAREALGNQANRKSRSEKASALARNAVVRFSDVGRKVLRVDATVSAVYNFACRSEHHLGKSF